MTRLTNRGVDVGLENLRLVELLVPVGGNPDLAQRALLGEDDLGVEHAADNNAREAGLVLINRGRFA